MLIFHRGLLSLSGVTLTLSLASVLAANTTADTTTHSQLSLLRGGAKGRHLNSTISEQLGPVGFNSRDLQASCGGGNRGNGVCADGTCCSQWGWCGTSTAHCSAPQPPPAPAPNGGTTGSGTCGGGSRGNGVCADGTCCSEWGWCGSSSAHCSGGANPPPPTPTGTPPPPTGGNTVGTCGGGSRGNGICSDGTCCSEWGWCGTSSTHCGSANPPPPPIGPPPPPPPPTGSSGTCGGGSRGDGVCADGTCCSEWGWCGTSSDHCGGSGPTTGGPPPPPPPPGNGLAITSPAVTLSTADVQTALERYNTLQGAATQSNQALVDELNRVTQGYSLYRQLAFVAQTIWESGGYQYTEELAAVTPPYATRDDYQDCDWGTPGFQLPANGKKFFGRGYMQLSWCANYRAYGQARMVNGDPDYFYKNPELVATTYAMDSAAWFFEAIVSDNSGQFGTITNQINGAIECSPGSSSTAPQKRYEIFDAIASRIGLVGYGPGGC